MREDGWRTALLGEIATCLDSMRIPIKEEDRQRRVGNIPYYGANGQAEARWRLEELFASLLHRAFRGKL